MKKLITLVGSFILLIPATVLADGGYYDDGEDLWGGLLKAVLVIICLIVLAVAVAAHGGNSD